MFEFLKKWFPKVEAPQPGLKGVGDVSKFTPLGDVVASVAPIVWKPLDTSKLPSWPIYDQGNTSSCVAHGKALADSILYYKRTGTWIDFSRVWVYSKRAANPVPGMYAVDAFEIDKNTGPLPDVLLPSAGLSEDQMNNPKTEPWFADVAKVFELNDEPILIPIKDIDTLVSVHVITGKPIVLCFGFNRAEWTSIPKYNGLEVNIGHCVTMPAPKNADDMTWGIYEGEKAIIIQESWGLGSTAFGAKRIIKESFFKERHGFAGYAMRFKFEIGKGSKPSYDPSSIISLQKCLQYEGLFPMNVSFVENFGPTTRRSLAAFQAKYGLPQISDPSDPQTVAKLTTLY